MSAPSEHLVAIASGTNARTAGWANLLRAESIEYVIQTPCREPEQDEPDHVVLWVHKEDAERAKLILRRSVCDEGPSLWRENAS
jgi:hypothetical protein